MPRETPKAAAVVVEPVPVVADPPAREKDVSVGGRRVIATSNLPAIKRACNDRRVVWTDVGGEVSTYSFGDNSASQLSQMSAVAALALSGDDLYAVVREDGRWAVAVYQDGASKVIARDVAQPDPNIAADAQSVVWLARHDGKDALFVLDRKSGRIEPRPLGNLHWMVTRIVIDRRHAFVLAEDTMHKPHLYDADLAGSGVRELPKASELEDIGAANGILIGLRSAEGTSTADLMIMAGAPERSVAQFAATYHPSVVVGSDVACFFSSDDRRLARIGCVDLTTGTARDIDRFVSNWEFLSLCGDKRVVWTRPLDEDGKRWDLVYADLPR